MLSNSVKVFIHKTESWFRIDRFVTKQNFVLKIILKYLPDNGRQGKVQIILFTHELVWPKTRVPAVLALLGSLSSIL